ncbi:MAG: hypothetical protein M3Y91_16865 [Actinomycetota bacterium]|nr:hypothetical protein [Actinomycetota bacterium]
MTAEDRTWIVMLRDVSQAVRVEGEAVLMASMVLDQGTGLALSTAVGPTGREALGQALDMALTRPARPLTPRQPDLVLCAVELVADVEAELASLVGAAPLPPVTVVEPVAEAEDIFDSLTGHLSGRSQPDEFAAPADWQILFDHAWRYHQVQPWTRWDDAAHLTLSVTVGEESSTYVATVIGTEGVQAGLILHPGTALPAGLGDGEPGRPFDVNPGTLMFFLDPPAEVPPGFAAKAARYGWPADAELVPSWFAMGNDGPSDVSHGDVERLSVAIAAVLGHDQRGPIAVGGTTGTTTGEVTLAGDLGATFSIRQ